MSKLWPYVALLVLCLGLTLTILAVSTENWFETTSGNDNYEVSVTLGLWKVCNSLKSKSLTSTKCFSYITELDDYIKLLSDDFDEDEIRDKIYPGYVKAIEALEIFAVLAGAIAIGVWLVQILSRKPNAMWQILTIVLVLIIAVLQSSCIGIWVHNKEKDKADTEDVAGVSVKYGWSMYMAGLSAFFNLVAIAPVFMTKRKTPDDGMDNPLSPREIDI